MDKNFGDMLRIFRMRIGLTQNTLAEMTGIDTSYISRIERGERKTTRSIAIQLAGILQLSQEELDLWLISAGFISPRMQELRSAEISRLIEDISP